MNQRIAEFLARYDARKLRGGTLPAVWLDEAAGLLREVARSAAPMTQELFGTQATELVADALEAELSHDAIAAELEHLVATLRE